MSLLDAPYRYTQLQKTLLAIVGLVLFLLFWWGMAEVFSQKAPVGFENSRMPSSLETNPDSVALRAELLRKDSIAFADATNFKKIYPLLPPPHYVFDAFIEIGGIDGMMSKNKFTRGISSLLFIVNPDDRSLGHHARISIWRNLQGYFWAVFFSLLIGIPIAVSPLAKALFSRQIDTLRYVPITALTPIFFLVFSSAWFTCSL